MCKSQGPAIVPVGSVKATPVLLLLQLCRAKNVRIEKGPFKSLMLLLVHEDAAYLTN